MLNLLLTCLLFVKLVCCYCLTCLLFVELVCCYCLTCLLFVKLVCCYCLTRLLLLFVVKLVVIPGCCVQCIWGRGMEAFPFSFWHDHRHENGDQRTGTWLVLIVDHQGRRKERGRHWISIIHPDLMIRNFLCTYKMTISRTHKNGRLE